MGMFLAMSGIIGKSKAEVINSLDNYAKSAGGGLETAVLSIQDNNCCVIEEFDGNTSVFYPYGYLEWDKSSEYISKELNAPVFSFHVHDGDLWMYVLFVDGKTVDQFNPIPDYWQENLDEEEIRSWQGNPHILVRYAPWLKVGDVENYLVRWNLEADVNQKAYQDDQFSQEDWQLLDFMRKLRLPYPLDDNGHPKGQTFRLWTKELPFKPASGTVHENSINVHPVKRPWWKIW